MNFPTPDIYNVSIKKKLCKSALFADSNNIIIF